LCIDPERLRTVVAALREDRAIYGLAIRNFAVTGVDLTVESIAASHLRQLSLAQARGPYHLLGYSFGGLIAYEMAVRLVREGRKVASLALIDTPHPAFRQGLSATEAAVVASAYLADRKAKYLANLRRGRFDLLAKGAFGQVLKGLQPWVWAALRRLCHAVRRPAPVTLQDWRIEAMENAYRPAEFAGRMLLFRAEGREAEFAAQPAMGWSRCVRGSVDIRYALGPHEALFRTPYAEMLARQIEDALPAPLVP
jgi:thioesterase domain-containing protein